MDDHFRALERAWRQDGPAAADPYDQAHRRAGRAGFSPPRRQALQALTGLLRVKMILAIRELGHPDDPIWLACRAADTLLHSWIPLPSDFMVRSLLNHLRAEHLRARERHLLHGITTP